MKISQEIVDYVMFGKAGCSGDYSDLDTLITIRKAVRTKFDVEISNTEAHKFWRWRSEKFDAGFLACESDIEIVKWFEKYFEEWWDGDNCNDYLAPYEMKKEIK